MDFETQKAIQTVKDTVLVLQKLKNQNNILLQALTRIRNSYDNVEDLAGAVAKEAIEKYYEQEEK